MTAVLNNTRSDEDPNILYILGAGRSGTTILEVVLTGNRRVVGVGEVTHVFKDGFLAGDQCACGVSAPHCPMWARVREIAGWSDSRISELARLFRRFDWHSGFLKSWLGWQSGAEFDEYAKANRDLFRAVVTLGQVDLIVDSSKYAARAINLNRIFGTRVRVLCLIRSPEGLLNSFRKDHKDEQKPKSHFALILYYCFILISMRIAAYRFGARAYPIRYEDLVSDPDRVLADLQTWLGVDLSESRRRVVEKVPFSGGHIVTGNRLRKSKEIVFRIGEKKPSIEGVPNRITVAIMRVLERLLGIRPPVLP